MAWHWFSIEQCMWAGQHAGRGGSGRNAAYHNINNQVMQHTTQARGMWRALHCGYNIQRQKQQGGAVFFQGYCLTCGEYRLRQRQCPSRQERSNLVVAPSANNADHLLHFQELGDELSHAYAFMISAQSSVTFPFGSREALVSIDSNCSRHMAGFYMLLNFRPSDVLVDGSFQDGAPGRATSSGLLQLGRLFFHDAVHVPGLRETIISLGAL